MIYKNLNTTQSNNLDSKPSICQFCLIFFIHITRLASLRLKSRICLMYVGIIYIGILHLNNFQSGLTAIFLSSILSLYFADIWSHTTHSYQSKEDFRRRFCWSEWMHNCCNYSIKTFLLAKIFIEVLTKEPTDTLVLATYYWNFSPCLDNLVVKMLACILLQKYDLVLDSYDKLIRPIVKCLNFEQSLKLANATWRKTPPFAFFFLLKLVHSSYFFRLLDSLSLDCKRFWKILKQLVLLFSQHISNCFHCECFDM